MMSSKKKAEEWERKYDELLAEKMELEYQWRKVEREYVHEASQREEILRLHEKARRLKHDMKNHVMVVTAFLQKNQVEEAKEYLSNMLDILNGMYAYIETGNSLLSHVLNQKLEYAHEQGMLVKAQIENLGFAKMESVDFVSLFTNLLDNAIEGATTKPGGTKPEIHVQVENKRGYDTITVKNTVKESVLQDNPELCSTKEDSSSHGIGVFQIKQIVEKYEGLYRFYEEDGMFCAAVMIPKE